MMELGITQSTDTHNKRSLIRTSHVCQRHRAAGRNQHVEGYKHTHTHTHTHTETTSVITPRLGDCQKNVCIYKKIFFAYRRSGFW